MRRTTIIDSELNFIGWFDADKAEEIADFKQGDPYVTGKILLATASGKLVVNEWTNTGTDFYRLAEDDSEIAEILVKSGAGNEYPKKLAEILARYEL